MRLIAITNQKGGSGKTTTAVNLAAAIGERGKRTLLLDLDPQGTATGWLGLETGRGLFEVFTDGARLTDLVQETQVPGVDLIPAAPLLIAADKALAGEVGAEGLLKKALMKLPQNKWDFCLIDCPPSLSLLTLSALTAASEVLVPVETHVLALSGLAELVQTVETVKDRLNSELKITAILACRFDRRTNHSREVVDQIQKRFGRLVLKTAIRESVRLAEAPSFHQPITSYASNTAGAEDYRAVAAELLRRRPV